MEQRRDRRFPWRRWLLAALASTFLLAVGAAYLNWRSCWLYMSETEGVTVVFVLAWVWLLLILGFHLKGRIVLGVCTVAMAIVLPNGDAFPSAAKEAREVGELRQFALALVAYKAEHPELEYPETLPRIDQPVSQRKFYVLDYVRTKSPSEFEVRATPTTRSRGCGCVRSFTITSTGHLYYTMENRPASSSDSALQ